VILSHPNAIFWRLQHFWVNLTRVLGYIKGHFTLQPWDREDLGQTLSQRIR
jgi:hypothetical protein